LYSAIIWKGDTSDALVSLMYGKEMCFQVPPKTFRLNGQIMQWIRHWVPNSQTSESRKPGRNMCCYKTVQYSVCSGWLNGDVGSSKLRRLTCSRLSLCIRQLITCTTSRVRESFIISDGFSVRWL